MLDCGLSECVDTSPPDRVPWLESRYRKNIQGSLSLWNVTWCLDAVSKNKCESRAIFIIRFPSLQYVLSITSLRQKQSSKTHSTVCIEAVDTCLFSPSLQLITVCDNGFVLSWPLSAPCPQNNLTGTISSPSTSHLFHEASVCPETTVFTSFTVSANSGFSLEGNKQYNHLMDTNKIIYVRNIYN